MSPNNPVSLSRKRPFDRDGEADNWPRAKRQTVQALASLISSSSVSTRKRSREVSDDDEQTHKRSRKDTDDEKLQSKDLTRSPRQFLDFRTNLKSIMQRCITWEMCCEMLNAIPHTDEQLLPLVLNDLPEWARLKAFDQLQSDNKMHQKIIEDISNFQKERSRYDPKSLFPCVSTPSFLNTLPSPARLCYICAKVFTSGASIIWKPCGRHTLHEECLRTHINDLHTPLFGLCGCTSED